MKQNIAAIFISIALALLLASCANSTGNPSDAATVEGANTPALPGARWMRNASIYEVNLRQYTEEGTIAAFERHLPRIKELGVEILWFMPIHPISKLKRKGSLGSYYAVADYQALNPEFGDLEDFKRLVAQIHELDMQVILDWVPNHTGWDHPWIEEHPDWYTKNDQGEITDPLDPKTGKSMGWDDVADLDYSNTEMRREMIEQMAFWLREADVDGFRCDVAWGVPVDFWRECISALREINPDIFMLAEAEEPELRQDSLFQASYSWTFHHLMNDLANGKAKLADIDAWLAKDAEVFPKGFHMQFITNHDENSFKGSEYERMGPAVDAMAVLAFTLDGMPLVYSGQEGGLEKRLEFFEKDQIDWSGYSRQLFYATLIDLKRRNRALWNGPFGGRPSRLSTGNDEHIYAFYREKEGDQVIVVLNLSAETQDVVLNSNVVSGEYTDVFANSTVAVTKNTLLKLNPWDFVVWSNR